MKLKIYLHKKDYHTPAGGRLDPGKVVMIWLLVMASLACSAQQIPLFSTYTFNKFPVNPAFTGIDNQYRGFGFYRSQWGSMPGRPVTAGATVEGSFWKDRIGGGLLVMNDQIGVFNQTFADLAYCQKIQLGKEHQLAVGVQGGLLINRIDFAALQAHDVNDPGIVSQRMTQESFDFSMGLSYKWKSLLLGLSVPNILQPNAKYAETGGGNASFQYIRHYTAFGQYRFGFSHSRFGITPTTFVRKSAFSQFQLDGSLLFDYKNIIYAGGGYRTSYGVTGIFGLNVFNMFTVAYAYDYTTQPVLNGNVGPTHEVTFGFHLPSNFKRHHHDDESKVVELDKDSLQKMQSATDSLVDALKTSNKNLNAIKEDIRDLAFSAAAAQYEADSLESELNKMKKDQHPYAAPMNVIPGIPVKRAHATLPGTTGAVANTGNENAESFTLDKIYFSFNKYELLPASKTQLDSLAEYLGHNKEDEIEVIGYTDNVGSPETNKLFSELRAKAVVDFLVAQGISASRLGFKGVGSENPVADNSTELGRRQNRRVEFVIKKK